MKTNGTEKQKLEKTLKKNLFGQNLNLDLLVIQDN